MEMCESQLFMIQNPNPNYLNVLNISTNQSIATMMNNLVHDVTLTYSFATLKFIPLERSPFIFPPPPLHSYDPSSCFLFFQKKKRAFLQEMYSEGNT